MWVSIEILDCLQRKRDICVKAIITSQNTAFMLTPALNRLFTQKYQNIIPEQVDKGAFTIYPHFPRFYYIFIQSLQSKFSLYVVHSLGTLDLEFASWQNALRT